MVLAAETALLAGVRLGAGPVPAAAAVKAVVVKDPVGMGHAGAAGPEAGLTANLPEVRPDVHAGRLAGVAVAATGLIKVEAPAAGLAYLGREAEVKEPALDAAVTVVVRVAGPVTRERPAIGPDGRAVLAAAEVGAAPGQEAARETPKAKEARADGAPVLAAAVIRGTPRTGQEGVRSGSQVATVAPPAVAGFHPSTVLRFLVRPDAGAGATASPGRGSLPVGVVAGRPVMVAAAVSLEPIPEGVTGPPVPLAARGPPRPNTADASGRARGAAPTAPIGAEVAVPAAPAG